ncbi:MAG TPA: Fe-S metabolism protein SufE [Flavobacteriales bacterium]|nr:Fe-S metabolism protein SufE [Flavobacteriales bacterium]HRE73473.1 SufE family protein [Flavobacteriales bacterium]HRJ38966.1 SufE family protein [Flavobacteriales bacterium]
MSIKDKESEIVEEFAMFEDWDGKYEYLIDLGKDLPAISAEYKTDDYKIKGCQSQVWLHAELIGGRVRFTADSDAIITKGIIALLVRVFDDETPDAIAEADLQFINEIGLAQHLSPTRSNGLLSMIKQMKMYAIAFKVQNT